MLAKVWASLQLPLGAVAENEGDDAEHGNMCVTEKCVRDIHQNFSIDGC